MLYGKLSINQTVMQIGRVVLQLQLELDLLHCGTVCSSMQMP